MNGDILAECNALANEKSSQSIKNLSALRVKNNNRQSKI